MGSKPQKLVRTSYVLTSKINSNGLATVQNCSRRSSQYEARCCIIALRACVRGNRQDWGAPVTPAVTDELRSVSLQSAAKMSGLASVSGKQHAPRPTNWSGAVKNWSIEEGLVRPRCMSITCAGYNICAVALSKNTFCYSNVINKYINQLLNHMLNIINRWVYS